VLRQVKGLQIFCRHKLENKLHGTMAFCYVTPSQKLPHIYDLVGLINVFRTSSFWSPLKPNEYSPQIPELFFQDAFPSFHFWLCLPSCLSSSGLQSTFQNVYGKHKVMQSRRQLNVVYYLDQPKKNVYINNNQRKMYILTMNFYIICTPIQKIKAQNISNYNTAHCSVWV